MTDPEFTIVLLFDGRYPPTEAAAEVFAELAANGRRTHRPSWS